MKVTVKNLTELRPMEKNIRRHSQKQISEYVRSVKMFGQIKPLVVDDDGVIMIGNGLFEALKAMGAETADCYIMSGLTEKEKKKLMLADNRVYELGMTDTDMFDEIIRSLEGDVDVPGWDAELLETLNATIHEVNEMVDSYGSYDPEDIQRINDRQDAVSGLPDSHSAPPQDSGNRNTSPEIQTQEGAIPRPTAHTIVCPKCGEVIEIGGV